MKKKLMRIGLLLLSLCLLLSSCQRYRTPDESAYDLPEDARTEVRADKRRWAVKQQVEQTLPITLPEQEDFALISHASCCFFPTTKKCLHTNVPITHARYDGNKYYVRFFDEEWLWAPDADGTYWLYRPKRGVFRRQRTSKTEKEVLHWFFTDLSDGSVSIAMLLGVWGEPTGKQATIHIYDYNKGSGDYVTCSEYEFHGIFQYADPATGLAVCTLACCDWRETDLKDAYSDLGTSAVYTFTPRFEGENVWYRITKDNERPVLAE